MIYINVLCIVVILSYISHIHFAPNRYIVFLFDQELRVEDPPELEIYSASYVGLIKEEYKNRKGPTRSNINEINNQSTVDGSISQCVVPESGETDGKQHLIELDIESDSDSDANSGESSSGSLSASSTNDEDVFHEIYNISGDLKERLFQNLEFYGKKNKPFFKIQLGDLISKKEGHRLQKDRGYGMQQLQQCISVQQNAKQKIGQVFLVKMKEDMNRKMSKKQPVTLAEMTQVARLDRLDEIFRETLELQETLLNWYAGVSGNMSPELSKRLARSFMAIEQVSSSQCNIYNMIILVISFNVCCDFIPQIRTD